MLLIDEIFALGTFPMLVRPSISPETNSLNVFDSAATSQTLVVLTIIVAMVIAYGFFIYRTFRGKVKMDHMSY